MNYVCSCILDPESCAQDLCVRSLIPLIYCTEMQAYIEETFN